MKPLLRSFIAGMLALAALAAGPAHAAKDVVFAVASTFTTTDPYDANDTLSQAMAKSFYEGLFGFDKDMKMIPVLAESYTATPDGLVYTIKLKRGIKFHDGTDFKADAVKVNLDRVLNPENKLKRYGLYNNNTVFTLGFTAGLKAFTAAVLGGIGNVTGAALGGFVLGLLAALTVTYAGGQWENVGVFSLLVIILVFKPTGLLGQALGDRA